MQRCSAANRGRYKTMLHVEKGFPEDGDYGMLIIPACQILESELNARLLEPALPISGEMARVLRDAGDAKQAAILDKWGARELPATIGTACIVLLAIHRALERQDDGVCRFVLYEYRWAYRRCLRKNRLCGALNKLRNEFRNPACHGTAEFDAGRYGEFVDLLVTCPRFNTFDSAVVESDDGLLVAHLRHHAGGYRDEMSRRKK